MIASAVIASSALAQGDVGATIGASVPIGGAADLMEIGQQSGLFILFRAPGLASKARVDFTWANMESSSGIDLRDRFYWTSLGIVLAKPAVRPVASANRVDVPAKPAPSGYVILGTGSYHQKRAGAKRDALGVNAGAGIEFALGPFGAFAEARLHYIHDGLRTKLFPLGVGLRF